MAKTQKENKPAQAAPDQPAQENAAGAAQPLSPPAKGAQAPQAAGEKAAAQPAPEANAASANTQVPRRCLPLPLYFCGMLLWYELILRAATVTPFWGAGLWYGALFAVPCGLLLWLLGTVGSERANGCAATVFTVVGYLLFASQLVYHAVFHTYYTAFSAGNGAQVIDYASVIFSTVLQRSGYLALLAAPLAVMGVLRTKKRLPLAAISMRRRVRGACFAACVQIVAVCVLPFAGMAQNTPFALYFQTRVLTASVDKLGLITTMRHDLSDLVFGFEESETLGVDTGSMTVQDGTAADADDAGGEDEEVGNPDYVRRPQTLALDFAALAESEPNSTIAALHAAFAEVEPTYTNAKTGLFEGKNLIYIVAESFSPYAIDAVRTPTLYQMQHDGWYFPNFYTGVWGVSTLDGEYVADVGLVPKQGVWSLYQSHANALPFTLGNEFRADGAATYAYHNGLYNYYSREASHPNLGYDYKGVYGGLTMTDEWPRSDAELVDITTEEYINEDYFHVYYLTISGHLPYDGSDTQAAKNYSAVADLPYSEHVKNYLAANIELDKAMALLLQRLEEAGKLEDTVIVISPDHYPYGLSNEEISEMAGHTVETEFELYKSSLILYHAGTKGTTVKKYCSSLDVLPTVLNLFAMPYDSRLLAGQDIFSDAPAFVPFITKSFLTDKAMYNATTNTVTQLAAGGGDAAYIAERSAHLSQVFSLSRKILETNYYAYLPSIK